MGNPIDFLATGTAEPTTKIVIPPNLRDDMVKQRKTYIKKKQIMADLNPEVEKKRIDEFLELLDITDI